MTKILMRAGFSPLDSPDEAKIIFENLIWDNAGNMLFPYSIMRILMREDTVITTISTDQVYSGRQVAQWNEEYDFFVIPLANAFRESFLTQLRYITLLVKKLTIPCIVVGVGLQVGVGGKKEASADFDREVTEFVKAVLNKSAYLGIRGEFTAQYLRHLGFAEEKDFTIIGCPSMYLYGPRLPRRDAAGIDETSSVSVNFKIQIPAKLSRFILSSARQFEHYTYIPQGIDDLLLLYAGVSIDREKFPKVNKGYPWQMHSRICASGCEAGFTDVRAWLAFLQKADFSFGTRIHGNIAAILAGTPAFIFAPDGRILELARYHQIQHMAAEDIGEDTDIFKVYEHADFSSVYNGHAQRFAHYASFLERNGLKHIYMEEDGCGISPFMEGDGCGISPLMEEDGHGISLFDQRIMDVAVRGPVLPFNKLPLAEQTRRLQAYYAFLKAEAEKKSAGEPWVKKLARHLPKPLVEKLKSM